MTSIRNAVIALVTFCLGQIAFEKAAIIGLDNNNNNNHHITDRRSILANHHDVDIDEEMALLSKPRQEEFLKQIQSEIISLDDDSYNDIDIDGTDEDDDDTIAAKETNELNELTATATATATPWYVPYLAPSQPMDLPFFEWEIESSSNNRVCNPPDNIPRSCCLGATKKREPIVFDNKVCRHPIENHYKVSNYTIEYINNNMRYEDSTMSTPNVLNSNVTVSKQRYLLRQQRNRQLKSTYNSDLSSSINNKLIVLPKQDCDICRIIDYLIIFNWTLAIQGDSVSHQSFHGMECELRRRGYSVQSYTNKTQPLVYYWKFGIFQTTTIIVSWPESDASDGSNNNNETKKLGQQRRSAKIVNYLMYRPAGDNKEIDEIIVQNSDIVVFDHGLHYNPNEQDLFVQEMSNLLRPYQQNRTYIDKQRDHIKHPWANKTDNIRNSSSSSNNAREAGDDNNDNDNNNTQPHRLKLVAWRQTTSQHFNSTGGHFQKGNLMTCTMHPKPDGPNDEGFRLPLMKQVAAAANYTLLNVLDPQFATTSRTKNQDELVILPYRDYTIPLYYLHPNECTHYCHNPYMWLPIWRTLRIAMERTVRLHQLEE